MNDDQYFPSDGDYDDDNDSFDFGDEDEDIKSRFSNYSMTSSVIRRTEGYSLMLLQIKISLSLNIRAEVIFMRSNLFITFMLYFLVSVQDFAF